MLIVVAPVDPIWQTSAVNSSSARVASIGENSTSSTYPRACATRCARLPLDVIRGRLQLGGRMWDGQNVEMNV